MRFVSTRDPARIVPLSEALFSGLAPDGGLYLPTGSAAPTETEPGAAETGRSAISALIEGFSTTDSYAAMASRLVATLNADDGRETDETSAILADYTCPFAPALRQLSDRIWLLELFHGPTCAFKDFGASFLAHTMERMLQGEGRRAVILTATSGDTGSAVAHAFHRRRAIEVVVLYPSQRISPLQERQLTYLGDNIHALEVAGSFDDCQRMAKEAFSDHELNQRLNLASANSINPIRLLPQAFYYIYAWACLRRRIDGPIRFCVPSGNFGNLTAGVMAQRWGMAVDGFIAATNVNDIVPRYLADGQFRPRPSQQTLSNAMDVGNPSNFERLAALFGNSADAMRARIVGHAATDKETLATIARWYRRTGQIVDPHTATGLHASELVLKQNRQIAGVITLATAHPAKFADTIHDAIGIEPEMPARLARILDLPDRKAGRLRNDLRALKGYLLERLG